LQDNPGEVLSNSEQAEKRSSVKQIAFFLLKSVEKICQAPARAHFPVRQTKRWENKVLKRGTIAPANLVF
jgi:hypothetical protein